MAEERKPKIDLKARLQKTQGIPAPTPAPTGVAQGAPVSVPAPAMPAPAASGPASIPAPVLPGGAAVDPLGGLGRAAPSPFHKPQPEAPVAPPAPQRIEVDDSAVQAARKGALKTALGAGAVFALLFGVVGVVVGGARERSAQHTLAQGDAAALAEGVAGAKAKLSSLAEKTEAARNALAKEGKFPAELASELGGLNVDFNGSALAGRRFSGFPYQTTQELVAFVTAVQDINDRREALARMLTRVQKPITERLEAAKSGNMSVAHVVVLGQRDPSGNMVAMFAPLAAPISGAPNKLELPKEFTVFDTSSRANATVERYTGGAITKPTAVYVVPKTIESSFPSDSSTAAAQLASQLSGFLRELKGDEPQAEVVAEGKTGVIERAIKLEESLKKVIKN